MTQQDTFGRIVDALNEAMLDDTRWPDTSMLIDEACGAKGSLLAFGNGLVPGNIEIFFTKCYYRGEDRSEWWQEYFRLYHPVDEHLPRLRKLPDSKIVHTADLFSEDEIRTSLAYNEGLPRYEMQNGVCVRLDGPRGCRIVWGLADPVDASGWSSSWIDMVARLLPHLRQYVWVRSALVEARALGASVTELLTNTRLGVIQLDRRGRIVEANDVARELLRLADGLSYTHETLRAVWRNDDLKLQHLLKGALSSPRRQGASGSMRVRRLSSLLGLALHLTPVDGRRLNIAAGTVAALVLIADPASQARIKPDVMAKLLKLTPTEAEIAVLLAEGRTVRQIATATGRKYSTVRSHLKQIFAKLGVARQLDVARAVLALSSLPAEPVNEFDTGSSSIY